jgi:hypothetical protein
MVINMNISKMSFRIFVITTFVVSTIGALIDPLFPELLPEQIRLANEISVKEILESELKMIIFLCLSAFIAIAGIASILGLVMFKQWAPKLTLVATLVSYFILAMAGPIGMSGIAIALTTLSLNMFGAIVAIAFLSPIAVEFKGDSHNPHPRELASR